ncbi:hypothetical protein KXD40_007376 [Peronospora effusa]|nr:hypothetical protein KXD40_007376 [Peronospora effusa]
MCRTKDFIWNSCALLSTIRSQDIHDISQFTGKLALLVTIVLHRDLRSFNSLLTEDLHAKMNNLASTARQALMKR